MGRGEAATGPVESEMMQEITRRQLLGGAGTLLGGLAVGGAQIPTLAAGGFRFVHLTDLHIQPELGAERGVRQCIEQVNSLRPRPEFVITGGDLVMDSLAVPFERADLEWKLLRAALRDLEMPVYHTVGNHDVLGWSNKGLVARDHVEYGKAIFADRVGGGKTFRSFDHKGWHFVILDSIGANADQTGYTGIVDPAQVDWLKQDLTAQAPTTPIVVVTHIPMFTTWTLMTAGPAAARGGSMISNAHELRKLFKERNVRLVLQGHVHVRERIDSGNTSYIMSGAVSGNWWKGPTAGEFPECFGVVDAGEKDFEYRFQEYGWKAVVR
jgi:3',5'-cyclic AMP phosphodiesterase CpdA